MKKPKRKPRCPKPSVYDFESVMSRRMATRIREINGPYLTTIRLARAYRSKPRNA